MMKDKQLSLENRRKKRKRKPLTSWMRGIQGNMARRGLQEEVIWNRDEE